MPCTVASASSMPLPIFKAIAPYSIVETALQEAAVPSSSEHILMTCSSSDKGTLFIIDNKFTTPSRLATVNSTVAWCHYTLLRIVDSLELSDTDQGGNKPSTGGIDSDLNMEKIRKMRHIVSVLNGLLEYQAIQMLISLLSTLHVWLQSVPIPTATGNHNRLYATANVNDLPPIDPTPLEYSSEIYATPDPNSRPQPGELKGMLVNLEESIKQNQIALQVAKCSLLQVTKARFTTPHHIFASRWVRLRREIKIRETRHLELKWQKGLLLGQQEDLHSFMKSNNTRVPKGIASLMREACWRQAAQW